MVNDSLFIIFPTINTMLSAFFMAIFFPIALPPTVNDERMAVDIIAIRGVFHNNTTNEALIVPDTIPQISPITSLHILLVLLAFLISLIHSFEPAIFLMLWHEMHLLHNLILLLLSYQILCQLL